MSELNLFPSRLKEARIKADISQAELSRRTGIAPATLSTYESTENFKNPTIDKVVSIANALNISIDWLCGLEENISEQYNDNELFLRAIATLLTIQENGVEHRNDSFYFYNSTISEFIETVSELANLYHKKALLKKFYDVCIDNLITETLKKLESQSNSKKLEGPSNEEDDLPF